MKIAFDPDILIYIWYFLIHKPNSKRQSEIINDTMKTLKLQQSRERHDLMYIGYSNIARAALENLKIRTHFYL